MDSGFILEAEYHPWQELSHVRDQLRSLPQAADWEGPSLSIHSLTLVLLPGLEKEERDGRRTWLGPEEIYQLKDS